MAHERQKTRAGGVCVTLKNLEPGPSVTNRLFSMTNGFCRVTDEPPPASNESYTNDILRRQLGMSGFATKGRASAWVKRLGLIFAVWSVLGLFPGLQAHAYITSIGHPITWRRALLPALVNHWIWAALTAGALSQQAECEAVPC
jgi:hypothetical protein